MATQCLAQVVVNLILDMKQLGHPAFVHLDSDKVKERASQLPEDGVLPEVIEVIKEEMGSDDAPMENKLQPQKAATPCEAPVLDPAAAGAAFAAQRPRVVAAEGRSHQAGHEAEKSALEDMVAKLKSDGIQSNLQTFEVRTGNQLLDMFRPSYWSVAFCFLFPHATAEPDVTNAVDKSREGEEPKLSRRQRGNKDAPKVDIHAWAGAMQRQAASQFRRDWNFSPTLWNYLFRTMVNLEPNASMFAVQDPDGGGRRVLTNHEIQKGIQELYRKLQDGVYIDVNGEKKPVKGDMAKLRHVPTMSVEAHKVLDNVEARAKKLPGTHEVRTVMRHHTYAFRVGFGLAVFITFSPSERDSALMVKMGRMRLSDPANAEDEFRSFYSRGKPELDVEYCRLSIEKLAEARCLWRFCFKRIVAGLYLDLKLSSTCCTSGLPFRRLCGY